MFSSLDLIGVLKYILASCYVLESQDKIKTQKQLWLHEWSRQIFQFGQGEII